MLLYHVWSWYSVYTYEYFWLMLKFLLSPTPSIWSSTDIYPSHMGRRRTKARTTQGKPLPVKSYHLTFFFFSFENYHSHSGIGKDLWFIFFCLFFEWDNNTKKLWSIVQCCVRISRMDQINLWMLPLSIKVFFTLILGLVCICTVVGDLVLPFAF